MFLYCIVSAEGPYAQLSMSGEILSAAGQLYKKSHLKRFAVANVLEGNSRSSEMALSD